ncbi:hypothetical protein ETS23_20915 [Vibrio parahaemolyticus]|nr:hypothetical protein [Vibrio parahaemolyticus]
MLINISTMKGEVPRLEPHLLPDDAATVAQDCEFERGIVAPIRNDSQEPVTLPITPASLYLYEHNYWFTFQQDVSVIKNPMAQDPWQRVYWTGQQKPKLTSSDVATSDGAMPAAWYDLGVPSPEVPPVVTTVDESTGEEPPEGELPEYDDEDRVYIQTYVTRFGEEGAPGDASASVLVAKPGSTLTINLAQPGANTHNITHTRLYRSVTSDGAGDFLLVAELPISQSQYIDAARDVSGATLDTWDYTVPPSNMQGLCNMANGICAGFAGNEVMFSESYLPYAWPEDYRSTTDSEIVAIAPIETSLIVATKGKPYLFSGVMPSTLTGSQINLEQACVSASSLVVVNGMAMYASPDGLVSVGSGSATVLTAPLMTREQWQSYNPSSIRAWANEGKYVALCDAGAFVYDPVSQSFITLSGSWDAAYNDLYSDKLFLAKGNEVYVWKGDLTEKSLTWQSKTFLTPIDVLLTCARVQSPNSERLSVEFYADGELLHSIPAGELTNDAFRLPAIRATKWIVKIMGDAKVERILLATSMQELG